MLGNRQLINTLKQVDPSKPYGTELFDALAKVTISVAVEAVCLRFGRGKRVEVYMTRRSATNTAYPGEWHCPGSIMRPGENISDIFARLEKREFGNRLKSWHFVANANHPTEARGHIFSLVYLCFLSNKGADQIKGRWFPITKLPKKTVITHRKRVIPAAVGAFVAENTRICV